MSLPLLSVVLLLCAGRTACGDGSAQTCAVAPPADDALSRRVLNSKTWIESRDAFLHAALPHEASAFSACTLHTAHCVALLAPYFPCPFTLSRSNVVSAPGEYDGGKWTCGLADIGEARRCVIYSIGSGGNDIFERQVKALKPHCEIHVFDPTSDPLPGYSFHSYGLCGRGSTFLGPRGVLFPCKSLTAMMAELGHTHIDILKFDIEGAEWDVLTSTPWAALNIGQLLFEVHDFDQSKNMSYLLRQVFHPLEAAGLYQFSMEPVCATQCPGQYEFAFINAGWNPLSGLPLSATATTSAYDRVEVLFDELDAWTRQENQDYSDRMWGIASLQLYAMTKTQFVFEFLRGYTFSAATPTICEIGFNAGHSALLFLEALPSAVLYSFDLADLPWAPRNAEWMAGRYPGRFSFLPGDSALTLAAFASRGIVCDVILVDGSKEVLHRQRDTALLRTLSSSDAVVFLDEVSSEGCLRGSAACEGSYADISSMYASLLSAGDLSLAACIATPTAHDGFCAAHFGVSAAVTVVSGWWEVPNKHSSAEYDVWLRHALRLQAPLVFFYQDEAVRAMVSEIRAGLPTHFVVRQLSDFAVQSLYDRSWVHERHIPSAQLGIIWLEKVFMVADAATLNFFRTPFFAWVDAGNAAYRYGPPPAVPWPSPGASQQLPSDRVVYTHESDWYHNFSGTSYLYAGSLAGRVTALFRESIRSCAASSNDFRCGHDQHIWTLVLKEVPELFLRIGDGYGAVVTLLFEQAPALLTAGRGGPGAAGAICPSA